MFERSKYKSAAKTQLQSRWNIPIVMNIVLLGISFFLNVSSISETTIPSIQSYFDEGFAQASIKTSYSSDFFQLISGLITLILFMAQLHVYNKMQKSNETMTFNHFLEGLTLWIKAILAGLWYSLWTFLWSLLFVIPGIVKAFSYSQMFFIIAENPNISVTKAMRISKVMTKGYKSDLFVMLLSFIGWYFLSFITLGIGFLWLNPYIGMSMTNAYQDLKQTALKTGLLLQEDFQ